MNFVSKKPQDNEKSPIRNTDFLPQGIKKNSLSICHKLFLNIHPKASLFSKNDLHAKLLSTTHLSKKAQNTFTMLSSRSYFSSREMQRNLDTILGSQF